MRMHVKDLMLAIECGIARNSLSASASTTGTPCWSMGQGLLTAAGDVDPENSTDLPHSFHSKLFALSFRNGKKKLEVDQTGKTLTSSLAPRAGLICFDTARDLVFER